MGVGMKEQYLRMVDLTVLPSRNSSDSLLRYRVTVVPTSSRSVSSIVYSTLPSDSQQTALASGRQLSVSMRTLSATMKAE